MTALENDMYKNAQVTDRTGIPTGSHQVVRVGYVSLNDCAPLAMAYELGLFQKYGLRVLLSKELGWASIRDKIVYGELHAAHAVTGLPFAATFGIGTCRCDCVTGFVINLQGNAICISRKLFKSGITSAKSLKKYMGQGRSSHRVTFGVVSKFSSHYFLLRRWLESGGIAPDEDVRILVVPPSQVTLHLARDNIDGFCVGEPWNTVAVDEGIGDCIATSREIVPRHPEKVLMVRKQFAEESHERHLALIAALLESCEFCSNASNLETIVTTLTRKGYIGISENILRMSLREELIGQNERGKTLMPLTIFSGAGVNDPDFQKEEWVRRSLCEADLVPYATKFGPKPSDHIFRPDIFQEAYALYESRQNEAAAELAAV